MVFDGFRLSTPRKRPPLLHFDYEPRDLLAPRRFGERRGRFQGFEGVRGSSREFEGVRVSSREFEGVRGSSREFEGNGDIQRKGPNSVQIVVE